MRQSAQLIGLLDKIERETRYDFLERLKGMARNPLLVAPERGDFAVQLILATLERLGHKELALGILETLEQKLREQELQSLDTPMQFGIADLHVAKLPSIRLLKTETEEA